MKNLQTFEEFVNESLSLINENLKNYKDIYSTIEEMCKDLDLKIVSTEKIKFTAKGALERIDQEVAKGNYAFVLSFNENPSEIIKFPQGEFDRKPAPYFSLAGIAVDKSGKIAQVEPGTQVYIKGHSGMYWEAPDKPYTLGQLGLAAHFVSGDIKQLTPIKDHFWYNGMLNKMKGTQHYLVVLKA